MAPGEDENEIVDEEVTTDSANREAPRHGFRGAVPITGGQTMPAALTVAVSREAGARGSSIASRAGAKLGWPVYNQELLEYMAQEAAVPKDSDENPSPQTSAWIETEVERLLRQEGISRHPSVLCLARVMLALAARGEAVLVGRGAGLVLPPQSTLRVRIVAPTPDRVAYMTEWLRLTTAEAARQVEQRDARRTEFLTNHFHYRAENAYQYDLILNSSSLGEDLCAVLIAHAAHAKLQMLLGDAALDRDADSI